MQRNWTVFNHVVWGLVLGTLVGGVMSIPIWWGELGTKLALMPFYGRCYSVLHAPAGCLADVWTDVLSLPPRGEAAWIVVPAIGVVFQWAIIGMLVGVFWRLLQVANNEK